MANNSVYSFDEKEDAEKIIRDGFPDGIIRFGKMFQVAKYYRQVEKLGPGKLEKRLVEFCQSQNKDFNPVTEAESIKKWVTYALNHEFRKIDSVVINQAEIDVLRKVVDLRHRKILYSALVLAKAKRQSRADSNLNALDNLYVNYSDFQTIIKMSKIRATDISLADTLSELIAEKFFILYSPEKETLRVNYAQSDKSVAITVNDPEQALEFYRSYFGGDIIYCSNCGEEVVRTSPTHTRCEKCAKEIRKKQDVIRKRKLKKKEIL